METQLTLAMMNDELGQARTSKKEFLDKIESIVGYLRRTERYDMQIIQYDMKTVGAETTAH